MGRAATFAHDELSTDKRNPTANANGMIYGFDWVNDGFLIVEPAEHTATELRIPVLDPKTPTGKPQSMPVPSPYWEDTLYWTGSAATNHAAMDSKGRVWMSSRFRVPEDQPSFCASHPSAAFAPQPRNFRQIQYYDPNGRRFRQVNTCFDSHHVQFAVGQRRDARCERPFQRGHRVGENQSARRDRERIHRSGMVQAVFRLEPGRKDRQSQRSRGRRHFLQRDSASNRWKRVGRDARADARTDRPDQSSDLRRGSG